MEKKNYKIIENREELSDNEIMAGVGFAATSLAAVSTKKTLFKILTIAGVSTVLIILTLLIYFNSSSNNPTEKQIIPVDVVQIKTEDSLVKQETVIKEEIATTPKNMRVLKDSVVKSVAQTSVESISELPETEEQIIIPFIKRNYADIDNALEIKSFVYGPTNVSKGYGEEREFKSSVSKLASEENSAWFKFTVQKDTTLTFHIVPKLKTDNFDFVLFRCGINSSCQRDIMRKKLEPVRMSFAWNTSHNCNTGLSSNPKDTLFQAVNYKNIGQGRTYEPALKVKAGETFYLLITTNLEQQQDPEGFMIYFYNTLPKKKANTYK